MTDKKLEKFEKNEEKVNFYKRKQKRLQEKRNELMSFLSQLDAMDKMERIQESYENVLWKYNIFYITFFCKFLTTKQLYANFRLNFKMGEWVIVSPPVVDFGEIEVTKTAHAFYETKIKIQNIRRTAIKVHFQHTYSTFKGTLDILKINKKKNLKIKWKKK